MANHCVTFCLLSVGVTGKPYPIYDWNFIQSNIHVLKID